MASSTAQTAKDVIVGTAEGVKEVYQQVQPLLEKAGETLGQSASYLWKLQIIQVYVDAATLIIRFILAFSFIGFLYWIANANRGEWLDSSDIFMCKAFLLFAFAITFAVLMGNVDTILTLLFNPEYYALSKLVNVLKGAVK